MTVELAGGNQRVQRMRRLARDRDLRQTEGRYVVEGPILVEQAIQAGLDLEQLLVPVSAAHDGIVVAAEAAGVPCGLVEDRVFAGLTSTRSAQPAIAEVCEHHVDGGDLTAGGGTLLVLAEVSDPGNAGTLVRTAEAFGVDGVVFAGGVDPYNPKVVRSAAGSTFRVPFAVASGDEVVPVVLSALAEAGYSCWATVPDGGITPEEVPVGRPVAVLLGNEPRGLTPEVITACDGTLTVPTVGQVESLNVAAAGAVLLYGLQQAAGR